jgi:hypothetical protein
MKTLSVGQRITLFRIDNLMAMTHRYELEVRSVLEPTTVGYEHRQRVAVVRWRGKRKDQYLDVGCDDIVLDGWNVPFKADSEDSQVFSGNACYNLVGDPAAIKGLDRDPRRLSRQRRCQGQDSGFAGAPDHVRRQRDRAALSRDRHAPRRHQSVQGKAG